MERERLERYQTDFKEAEIRLIDALNKEEMWRVAWEAGKVAAICEILLNNMESDATPPL